MEMGILPRPDACLNDKRKEEGKEEKKGEEEKKVGRG